MTARYVFLSGLTPIWPNPSDLNIVGLGEVRFYETEIPEPGGDFDEDGDVDGNDLLAWQRGEVSNPPSQSDLDDWQASFGSVASSAAAASTTVPEPATGIILLFGMVAMLFRRVVVVS